MTDSGCGFQDEVMALDVGVIGKGYVDDIQPAAVESPKCSKPAQSKRHYLRGLCHGITYCHPSASRWSSLHISAFLLPATCGVGICVLLCTAPSVQWAKPPIFAQARDMTAVSKYLWKLRIIFERFLTSSELDLESFWLKINTSVTSALGNVRVIFVSFGSIGACFLQSFWNILNGF